MFSNNPPEDTINTPPLTPENTVPEHVRKLCIVLTGVIKSLKENPTLQNVCLYGFYPYFYLLCDQRKLKWKELYNWSFSYAHRVPIETILKYFTSQFVYSDVFVIPELPTTFVRKFNNDEITAIYQAYIGKTAFLDQMLTVYET